ncbi:MAG: UDP-N-acetylmuramoyl-tripeptide--D-alanyl-D-alanine ligase [Cytophagales bacterium]|nr:UDP-N-acetylmuramoyl-tripeptide--D-alanyl-D-alanine ligase [Cytophagales bacterium]
MMTLALAHQLLPGAKLVGNLALTFARVHTDTRSLQQGDLFVALKGERFDAHDFLAQARASGAVAVLAQQGLAANGLSGLEVPDSKIALGLLAKNWRAHLAAQKKIPVIAVTGSNGKTTLTQMIASILQAWHGSQALATAGNFNNDIGVPLTLLRLRASHQCAVVELGMNHIGEIAELAAMTAPTVAVVNNAQREHQEFMGTVEAVARENGAVLTQLPADGTAVFPADDAYTAIWQGLAGQRRVLTFGFADADITASCEWQRGAWQVNAKTPTGPIQYALHMAGKHNVKNSLAAVACAIAAGVPASHIQQGLAGFTAVAGRSRTRLLGANEAAITLVDDTYNANPDSVIAAIDMLMDLPAPRRLVLGDMGEVGDQGPAFHAEVGAYAKARGIDQFWTIGELCVHAGGQHFESMDALLFAASQLSPPPASILVKGSRFMKMERVVQHLEKKYQENTHAA